MLGPNDVALKMRPGEITAHCGIFLLCINLGNTASDQNLYQLSKSEMLRKKRVGGSTFPPKKPDSLSTSSDRVNEFQVLREAWRNAAEAVRPWNALIGNWPENPTLSFKPCWLRPNIRCMGGSNDEDDICKLCGYVSYLLSQSEDSHDAKW